MTIVMTNQYDYTTIIHVTRVTEKSWYGKYQNCKTEIRKAHSAIREWKKIMKQFVII